MKPISTLSFAAIGLSVSVILYVLLVFDGVRVMPANNAVLTSGIAINLIGFGLARLERSNILLKLNGVMLALLILAAALGAFGCFCMGGGCERWSNCIAEHTHLVSLLNAGFPLQTRRYICFVVICDRAAELGRIRAF